MSESFVRRNLTTILVAMTTAAVTGGGTAVAATVVDFARNADKVDNIHAAPATTTASKAGKLIATGSDGKLPPGIIPTPTNADRVDGLHAVGASSTASKAGKLIGTNSAGQFPTSVIPKDATPFAQYVVVRSDAGSAAANASRLQSKINALTATADKRYVVLVEPGAYAFGTSRLTMKPFVDVVGAGPDRTVLTGGGGASADAATVQLAKDSALRQLTVKTYATSATAAPYVGGLAFNDASGAAEVSDVKVDVAYNMPQSSGSGRAYGVRHTGANLTLRDVDISVANGGVTNHGVYNTGFLTAERTTAIANGGAQYNYGVETFGDASIYMTYSSVTLTDSKFAAYNGGVNWGVKSYNGFGTLVRTHLVGSIALESHSGEDIAEWFEIDGGVLEGSASTVVMYPDNTANVWRGTQLHGGPVNAYGGATGTVTCRGVFDEARTFYSGSCPS
ncbi:MAG TPA: hypothetical protein VNQ77_08430 [Frankiaceae bacterium]|nr:hypothetical protein [Frankiaceae bacterium]